MNRKIYLYFHFQFERMFIAVANYFEYWKKNKNEDSLNSYSIIIIEPYTDTLQPTAIFSFSYILLSILSQFSIPFRIRLRAIKKKHFLSLNSLFFWLGFFFCLAFHSDHVILKHRSMVLSLVYRWFDFRIRWKR